MGKDKSKDRDAKRAGRTEKTYTGILELRGYYFGHGEENSGTRFNKTVEKIAEYCRIEISKEVYYLILYGEEPDFEEVEVPRGKVTGMEAKKFELDYRRLQDKIEDHQKDKCKCFAIIMGQCKSITKEVVKADKSYMTLERADDVVGLLQLLRGVCYGTDKKRYLSWIQQAQLRKTVNFAQHPGDSLQQYATNFLEQVKTLEDSHGLLVPTRDMLKDEERTRIEGEGDEEHEVTYTVTVLADMVDIKRARDKFVACLFLAGVDRKRYKDAIDEMNNDFLRHGTEFPGDVSSMVTWLLKRRGGTNTNYREDATTDGILTSFAQVAPRRKSQMKCAACGRQGHLAWDCYSITPAERAEYRQWQSARRSDDDSSVGSNVSSQSGISRASNGSGSSGSASGTGTRSGRRATSPRPGRKSVLGMSNFAFGVGERPASFN